MENSCSGHRSVMLSHFMDIMSTNSATPPSRPAPLSALAYYLRAITVSIIEMPWPGGSGPQPQISHAEVTIGFRNDSTVQCGPAHQACAWFVIYSRHQYTPEAHLAHLPSSQSLEAHSRCCTSLCPLKRVVLPPNLKGVLLPSKLSTCFSSEPLALPPDPRKR